MAKLKMLRTEVVGSLTDSKNIIDFLQRKGVIEITQPSETDSMFSYDTSASLAQFDKYLSIAQSAKEILNKYAPDGKGMLDSFAPLRPITVSEYLDEAKQIDEKMLTCYDLVAQKKQIEDDKAEIIRLQTSLLNIMPWKDLDIPTSYRGTKNTSTLIGSFPEQYDRETLLAKIAAELPEVEGIDIEIVSSDVAQTCAVVLCSRAEAQQVEKTIRGFGFVSPADPSKHPPKVRIERLTKRVEELENEIVSYEDAIRVKADCHKDIDFIIDHMTVRHDKYEALSRIGMLNDVFYLTGYIPEKYAEKTKAKLEEKYTAAMITTELDENEDAPVLLENNAFAAPVESITEMYSLPGKNDIDPNAIMAFFYYIFFGMMFSDAGYGLLMVLATAFILFKYKPEGQKRKTVMMYMYCGISTMFWGVMFGSFFGDIINIIRTNYLGLSAMRLHVWLNPQGDDIMTTMLWCFLFGIIHLFVGVAIKGFMEWRQGDKFGAICDVLSIYLAVGGAAPICAGMIIPVSATITTVGKYCALAGVALIILTAGRASKSVGGKLGAGLYALYNTVSGYFGDILSYSRLLALGLVTGIIGSVVNLMGALPANLFVKTILLVIVFVVGHTVNFGINVIGTYVHTNRLQYVEFFSRFYEGGGVAFKPLKVNSKTFKFKEETNNE